MKNVSSVAPSLRVLLAGSTNGSGPVLAAWLREQGGLDVTGGGRTTAEMLALATLVRPEVVLLDFHGLPVSIGYTVALFKELIPAPAVFLLTHDASPAMRRRCLAAGVNAVFDKTADLDALRAELMGRSLAATADAADCR